MGKNKKSGDSEKDKKGERIETRHKRQKKKVEKRRKIRVMTRKERIGEGKWERTETEGHRKGDHLLT